MVIALDRSPALNNAGVVCLAADRTEIALDLFRGALEAKLAFERSQLVSSNQQDMSPMIERCVTPDCLEAAENHLTNLPTYLEVVPSPEESEVVQVVPALDTTRQLLSAYDTVPIESRGYNPYLYAKPFELPRHEGSTQQTSAIIVFNLGLVYQTMCRNASKAGAFYEISSALLANEDDSIETNTLRVAIVNNFGVWCYDNGDEELLRACMDHLASLVEASADTLPQQVQAGMRSNIRFLLEPPNGSSPAA